MATASKKPTSVAVIVVALLVNSAFAVNIDLVNVGDQGNAPDTRYNGIAVGGVAYTYQMGKFDVTAGQYCEFLNAVARSDTYGLYNVLMDYDASPGYAGCNIKRSGQSGSYTYTVAADWANRPVNYVRWDNAARFCNWLTNGQPSGQQGLTTTEDGSYYLNGATDNGLLTAVTRKPNAQWVIPSEDEWYKAAYYDADKLGGAGYWDYPTQSNYAPSNELNPNETNNANYYDHYGAGTGGWTIGEPYYRTEVGAFGGSASAYGTFDQGGNVWQWNEAKFGLRRGLRGGSYYYWDDADALHASSRTNGSDASDNVGFRVALVPEPATLLLLVIAGSVVLPSRRRR